MYCSKCGTKNSGKGLFCKHCGASLVDEVLENEQDNYNEPYERKSDNQDKVINKNVNKNKTRTKTINKNKDNSKDKNKKVKNNNQREIVHKTSAFQKFMIFFMIIIIIVLTGGLIAAGLYIFQDKTVEVPNVVGSNVDQATLILENMDLRVKIKTEEVDDESKNNIVLKQSKTPGEFVAKNSRIVLTIGVYDVQTLDNYVGLSLKEAESKLKKSHIDYKIEEIESEQDDGIIISQSPTSGNKYDDDTTVILTVSKKKEIKNEEKTNDLDEEIENE